MNNSNLLLFLIVAYLSVLSQLFFNILQKIYSFIITILSGINFNRKLLRSVIYIEHKKLNLRIKYHSI